MRLSPERLEITYAYLRRTPPFWRWKLPRADEVKFHVTRSELLRGDCGMRDGKHFIRVSANCIGRTSSLMAVMAHEMVHVHLDRCGVKSEHGRDFKRCAALVCKHHGFDPKLF